MKTSSGRLAFFLASGVFGLLLFRPFYMSYLRRQMQTRLPEHWSNLPTNGRFSLMVPELSMTRYHDETLYAARVRQILIHGVPRNPYWRDDRGFVNWIKDCLPLYLLAGLAFMLGGDLSLAWIAATSLLGALWFFLFYAAFRWWSGRAAIAAPLALFSVLFPDFYTWFLDVNFDPAVMLDRWSGVFFQQHGAMLPYFHRLPFNFLSFFLLYALFLATWRLAVLPRRALGWACGIGLGYGLMVVVHPFEFVYGMATLAAFLVLLRVAPSPPETRRNFAAAAAASLLLPAVFAAALFLGIDAETRKDSVGMVGWVGTHRPYLTSLVHLIAAGLGALQFRREKNAGRAAAWRFLIAAQLAAFLCRNLQVVTGFHLSPFHYITLGGFSGALMLFLWLSGVLSRKAWWTRALGAAACALVLLLALAREKALAEKVFPLFGLPRDMEAALDWSAKTLPKDALVLSLSIETLKTVPLYTKAKVLVPPGDSNVSGLFTHEKYLRSVAQLLKTAGADVDLFLAERWPLPAERARIQKRLYWEQNYLARADLTLLEPAGWFFPYLSMNGSDETVLEGRRRVKALHETAIPVEEPHYLWVNDKDAHLFRRPPASLGGALVYENRSVRIYKFEAVSGS